jgi:hypothetical protein
VFEVVGKDTSFDPAAGSGGGTFISYIGVKCVGAGFVRFYDEKVTGRRRDERTVE